MRRPISFLAALFIALWAFPVSAAEIKSTFTPEIGYAFVDGHEEKYRVHHWTNTGFSGGIGEFTLSTDDIGNGFSLHSEARALPANADYLFDLEARKEDWGYYHFEFEQFRKYFDNTGGTHPTFTSLAFVNSGRDLYLDMGKIDFEVGLTPSDLPDIAFAYEYEYKQGTKSRLTWAAVTQAGITRNIGPSWQEIDEEVHVFELKANDNWNGTIWNAEQIWEHAQSYTTREEKSLSDTSTASQKKIRDHILQPEADILTSIFEAKRWFLKDKVMVSGGYRFNQVENTEIETILEMNESRVATTFSNPHQVADSPSTNRFSTHTGVGSFFWAIHDALNMIGKVKYENLAHKGFSVLNNDNAGSAPDGVIDRVDVSNTQNDLDRWGQGISLRYTGIPQLALYNDVEFEQIHNSLLEDRASASSGELFSRHTLNRTYRGTEVAGFTWNPNGFLTLNSQYRFRRDNIDYDDIRETDPTSSGAKSAFVDGQRDEVNEGTARASMHFCEWFNPTVRYQYRDFAYTVRFEADPLGLRADTLSHIYTVDLPVQVNQRLMITGSYQFQDVMTESASNEDTPQNYAPFHGDVGTWLVYADYLVATDVSVTASAQYQKATNVMDVNSTGIALGSDYDKVDFSLGMKFKVRKNITVEPSYQFDYYSPNENIEYGQYRAHVAWLGVTIDLA